MGWFIGLMTVALLTLIGFMIWSERNHRWQFSISRFQIKYCSLQGLYWQQLWHALFFGGYQSDLLKRRVNLNVENGKPAWPRLTHPWIRAFFSFHGHNCHVALRWINLLLCHSPNDRGLFVGVNFKAGWHGATITFLFNPHGAVLRRRINTHHRNVFVAVFCTKTTSMVGMNQ